MKVKKRRIMCNSNKFFEKTTILREKKFLKPFFDLFALKVTKNSLHHFENNFFTPLQYTNYPVKIYVPELPWLIVY